MREPGWRLVGITVGSDECDGGHGEASGTRLKQAGSFEIPSVTEIVFFLALFGEGE
jgi:hypothetical protein